MPSESLPPVHVEVHNIVDRSHVHRMQLYCSSNTFEPIAAIQYVLCIQKCSIQALEFRDDRTVKLLHHPYILVDGMQKEDETVDACRETIKQFNWIYDALQSVDDTHSQVARSYVTAGLVYTEAYLQVYTRFYL